MCGGVTIIGAEMESKGRVQIPTKFEFQICSNSGQENAVHFTLIPLEIANLPPTLSKIVRQTKLCSYDRTISLEQKQNPNLNSRP